MCVSIILCAYWNLYKISVTCFAFVYFGKNVLLSEFVFHTVIKQKSFSDVCLCLLPLQVIEVILPMLCNYLSYWWEKGPENSPDGVACCTMVTSEHLSIILGNILKILNNNLGIDDAPWMKRIAGWLLHNLFVVHHIFLPTSGFSGYILYTKILGTKRKKFWHFMGTFWSSFSTLFYFS